MSAQSDFLSGMLGFRLALEHEDIVDNAPSDRDHNLRAKTFRNGIAILGFAVLEHFIRRRTGEILDSFHRVCIPFDDLPDRLKKAATRGALQGILKREKYSADGIKFLQEESAIVASSNSTSFALSRYSLGFEGSNLTDEETLSILKTFGVKDAWNLITSLSSRLDMAIPNAKTSFINATLRRHDAAHNVNASVNPSDLQAFVRESYALAVGFDVLITSAFDKMLCGDKAHLTGNSTITDADLRIRRILKRPDGKWAEYDLKRSNAVRVGKSGTDLWPGARARAIKHKELLVSFSTDGYPEKWDFPFTVV
tara:strand:- start:868 stop:1797 length:930 start_codon:yes stop_codon:yes gene_type:complete